MATPFDEIYDSFLSQVSDYKLDKLYQIGASSLTDYLQGFLLRAIPHFDNCTKNLSDYDLTKEEFNTTLTLQEKNILSDLMVIQWMNKEIQDVNQMSLHLNDTDFKHYSEAQNLKAKSDYRDVLREIVNQNMVSYGLKNTDWTSWASGKFYDL